MCVQSEKIRIFIYDATRCKSSMITERYWQKLKSKRTLVATEDHFQVHLASSWLGSWARQNHFVPHFCSPRSHCYSFCCSSCYRFHFFVLQMQNLQQKKIKSLNITDPQAYVIWRELKELVTIANLRKCNRPSTLLLFTQRIMRKDCDVKSVSKFHLFPSSLFPQKIIN